jgi:hypothetical protein
MDLTSFLALVVKVASVAHVVIECQAPAYCVFRYPRPNR